MCSVWLREENDERISDEIFCAHDYWHLQNILKTILNESTLIYPDILSIPPYAWSLGTFWFRRAPAEWLTKSIVSHALLFFVCRCISVDDETQKLKHFATRSSHARTFFSTDWVTNDGWGMDRVSLWRAVCGVVCWAPMSIKFSETIAMELDIPIYGESNINVYQ